MNFLDRFSKNIQIQNFMKIRPVGAELFLSDRQAYSGTDRQTSRQTRHDETSSLRHFVKSPYGWKFHVQNKTNWRAALHFRKKETQRMNQTLPPKTDADLSQKTGILKHAADRTSKFTNVVPRRDDTIPFNIISINFILYILCMLLAL
jgi:hypothetical protein